ncbi:Fc.00g078660.m01.CDS01 [Cosmosporella sp. VM-42]
METLFPNNHHLMQLPPIDARITPPPDEMSPVAPKDAAFSLVAEFPETISTSSQSEGISTTPSSSTRRRHRRGTSSSSSRPRIDCKPPPQNASLIFSPRPYENLYTERAYLTTALQKQSVRTVGLIRHFSSVETHLQGLEGKERRKLRKQLSMLKSKLNGAAEQERAIFGRLGEVYVEIQSRETWTQASHSRSNSWDSYSMDTPSVYSAVSPMSYSMPTPTTSLNVMSAEFAPAGYFAAWQPTEEPMGLDEEVEVKVGLETVDEAGEEVLCSPDMPHEYYGADEMGVIDCPRRLSCDTSGSILQERRLSLPCLRTVWPEG